MIWRWWSLPPPWSFQGECCLFLCARTCTGEFHIRKYELRILSIFVFQIFPKRGDSYSYFEYYSYSCATRERSSAIPYWYYRTENTANPCTYSIYWGSWTMKRSGFHNLATSSLFLTKSQYPDTDSQFDQSHYQNYGILLLFTYWLYIDIIIPLT